MSASKPTVLALLPRGEAIRNFVYSGALDDLAERCNVSVATVVPNEAVRHAIEERFGPVVELEETTAPWRAGVWHELLDVAHGRWVWSEAARERWRLRDMEARTAPERAKRAGKRAIARVAGRPRGIDALERAHYAASQKWDVTAADRAVIEATDPSLVFNGSQVHGRASMRLMLAARSAGIPTASFLFSWDNLTSQGRIVPTADSYIVWNEKIRDDLLAMYPAVDPSSIVVTGTPQFDFHFQERWYWTRDEFCERVGLDPGRPIVLYSTGMPNHMPGEPDIVERIADALEGLAGPPQLVVRLYAKDRTNRFDALQQRRKDIVFPKVAWEPNFLTPLVDDTALWTNMLRHAALGLNVASTVSLELAMFDKPILNIAFNPPGVPATELEYARYYRFDHYAPVVASGAVELVEQDIELVPKIRSALERPDARSRQRRALLDTMFGSTLDGCSAHRVALALDELARTTPGRSVRAR